MVIQNAQKIFLFLYKILFIHIVGVVIHIVCNCFFVHYIFLFTHVKIFTLYKICLFVHVIFLFTHVFLCFLLYFVLLYHCSKIKKKRKGVGTYNLDF